MMDSEDLIKLIRSEALRVVQDTSPQTSFIHGMIDPAYASGAPKVTFDGETVLSAKTYKRLSSYTPTASDRVLLAKISGSYVILGKIV